MARLVTSGFEFDNLDDEEEFYQVLGTPTINTTTKRTGSNSMRCNLSSSDLYHGVREEVGGGSLYDLYVRAYVYIDTSVSSVDATLLATLDNVPVANSYIILTTTDTLELWVWTDTGSTYVQIGSASSALNTDQWYRIELHCNTTTASAWEVEGKIDGTTFASSSTHNAESTYTNNHYFVGIGPAGTGSADVYFDDIAVNDGSGSFQDSFPGEGNVIMLRPNASGDNSDWSGTYADIDDASMDDATTVISCNSVVSTTSDFNIEASGLTDEVINCVSVGWRHLQGDVACTDVLRIKASASGTVEESSNINYNIGGWKTHGADWETPYQLSLYDLPGASTTAWTPSDLDSAQIGIRHKGGSTNGTDCTALWLSVDYKDAPAESGSVGSFTGPVGYF